MVDEDESGIVSLDQLERILWWASGACWAIVALILLGEFQGWWNDAGEVGGIFASIIGGLLTVVALLLNATKSQVRAVRSGVTDNGRRLGMIHDGVRTLHHDNQQLHQDNERQTEILTEIRDRL